jgi:hypothetical protein
MFHERWACIPMSENLYDFDDIELDKGIEGKLITLQISFTYLRSWAILEKPQIVQLLKNYRYHTAWNHTLFPLCFIMYPNNGVHLEKPSVAHLIKKFQEFTEPYDSLPHSQ